MKTRKLHIIVVNDKIFDSDTNLERILKELKEIKKSVPTAYYQTIYA